MTNRSLVLSLALTLGVVACGGSSTPTGPDSSGNASGATITGHVGGSSTSMTAASAGQSMPGLVVTVAGTSITSGLDAAGRFTLRGVPSGDIQLQFSGPVSATITISGVQSTESITLVLAVSSSSVTIQSQGRSVGREEQLEGLVESLPPSMPAGSFKVAGRTVKTTATTEIRHGNITRTLGDFRVGYRVHVKGQTEGTDLVASTIFLQNTNEAGDTNDDDDGDGQDSSASIHGKVNAMSGGVPNLTLTVGTTIVRTSSGTEVKRRGDVQTLDEIEMGQDVHVIGVRQSDGSIDARRIELRDDETGAQVEIQGSAGGVQGSCPAITFSVNGYRVQTSAATTYDGITCATMKSGTKVTVKGTSQADNSIAAVSIKKN